MALFAMLHQSQIYRLVFWNYSAYHRSFTLNWLEIIESQNHFSEWTDEQAVTKLYFVVTGLDIQSVYPVHTFGDVQVVIYPKTNYQKQLGLIQNDLQKRVSDGEVSAELADVYQNLRKLNKALQNDAGLSTKYYDLYMRCFQLTLRQRNIPLPLQIWELERAGYNVER
jgi:hypothetical protein